MYKVSSPPPETRKLRKAFLLNLILHCWSRTKKMIFSEKEAWIALKKWKKVFGKQKRSQIEEIFDIFRKLKCNLSLQVYFLHSYLDYFSKCSLENVSEGQSEKFHQDIKKMEKIYKSAETSYISELLLQHQARHFLMQLTVKSQRNALLILCLDKQSNLLSNISKICCSGSPFHFTFVGWVIPWSCWILPYLESFLDLVFSGLSYHTIILI